MKQMFLCHTLLLAVSATKTPPGLDADLCSRTFREKGFCPNDCAALGDGFGNVEGCVDTSKVEKASQCNTVTARECISKHKRGCGLNAENECEILSAEALQALQDDGNTKATVVVSVAACIIAA